ncbi:hypothetical protein [Kribbella sindirgiensis]|uniref:Uncharacterized protein n=1 Tax=Kribbella sindirgiensis TaxID=1124744 RepID=A0A4R0IEL5_9ACTN|nr:hypothetical protein [Kribbella sindirgiensis]TCC30410.1 hypothetical protein E0H50_23645 [Kribbella sindirgiensis]
MAVGGVDTYYDYDERQWKYRRLGGGPVQKSVVCPEPADKPTEAAQTTTVRRERHTSATAESVSGHHHR